MGRSLVAQRGDSILQRLPFGYACQGVEVGVYDGRLSGYLLRENRDLVLVMIDRWDFVPDDHPYQASGAEMAKRHSSAGWKDIAGMAKKNTAFAGPRAVKLRTETPQAAAMFFDGSLDFVFIDADHSEEGAYKDIAAWWPKVRAGGFIGGHDIDHPETHLSHPDGKMHWGVRQAVERFFGGPGNIDLGK